REERKGFEMVEMRAIGARRQALEIAHEFTRQPDVELGRGRSENRIGQQGRDQNAPKSDSHLSPPGFSIPSAVSSTFQASRARRRQSYDVRTGVFLRAASKK